MEYLKIYKISNTHCGYLKTEEEAEGSQCWPEDRRGSWRVAVMTSRCCKPPAQGKKSPEEGRKRIVVLRGIQKEVRIKRVEDSGLGCFSPGIACCIRINWKTIALSVALMRKWPEQYRPQLSRFLPWPSSDASVGKGRGLGWNGWWGCGGGGLYNERIEHWGRGTKEKERERKREIEKNTLREKGE